MIYQLGDPYVEIEHLSAANRRLSNRHPSKSDITQRLINAKAGLKGEREVGFTLRFLDEHKYLILRSLRLEDEFGGFQMDNLLLTEKYYLILEVKNWYGTIFFGPNGQVTQQGDHNQEKGFEDPVKQAELQRHRLLRWLQKHGIDAMPIETLAVISFPRTIIKSEPPTNYIPPEVIHTNQLLSKIKQFDQQYVNKAQTHTHVKNVSKLLARSHIPKQLALMEEYNLTYSDLIKGVFCPDCASPSMTRKYGRWQCQACGCVSKDAHLQALNDYRLLVGPHITNRDVRDFLKVDSPDLTRYLLQKFQLDYSGATKGRVYLLDEKIMKQTTSNSTK